jgi:hypothetical protein
VNPAVALATKSVIYALGGGTGFFVTAAGFLAGAAVGSVMGYGVGIVGGAIGAAMAQGINGGWIINQVNSLEKHLLLLADSLVAFLKIGMYQMEKTETVKTEGHKEEYLFNKKGQSLWQDGQRQKLVSKYVIKAEQVNYLAANLFNFLCCKVEQ